MSGTVSGGRKCAVTNKAKYGDDWYRKIGAIGGRNGIGKGGFHENKALAREAGSKGGTISKRGKSLKTAKSIEKAKEMWSKGETRAQIANVLGVSVSTVSRYLSD